jgi:hypothetical protein
MKIAFTLPETPTIKVIYTKSGTTYSAVIPNPHNADTLLCTMLARQVGSSQIVRLEPIQPPREVQRGHPAQHRLAKYASLTACVLGLLTFTALESVELPASVVEWQNVC